VTRSRRMSWGPRSARKPPFGANNRGAVAPKLNQPVLYLLKRWQSRGGASTQNLLRNASADRRGISRAFLRGISLKECYRDAARCLKDGVTEPPAGKEARHRASAPRVCSGVASAVRGGVPGRLAPDLGFRRLDFLVFTIPTWAFTLFRFSGSPWGPIWVFALVRDPQSPARGCSESNV
jgi:hypothetical protein